MNPDDAYKRCLDLIVLWEWDDAKSAERDILHLKKNGIPLYAVKWLMVSRTEKMTTFDHQNIIQESLRYDLGTHLYKNKSPALRRHLTRNCTSEDQIQAYLATEKYKHLYKEMVKIIRRQKSYGQLAKTFAGGKFHGMIANAYINWVIDTGDAYNEQ